MDKRLSTNNFYYYPKAKFTAINFTSSRIRKSLLSSIFQQIIYFARALATERRAAKAIFVGSMKGFLTTGT